MAIETYDHVPVVYREPFEQTVQQINTMIASSIERLEKNIDDGQTEVMKANAQIFSGSSSGS